MRLNNLRKGRSDIIPTSDGTSPTENETLMKNVPYYNKGRRLKVKKFTLLALTIATLIAPIAAQAQSECSALLQHGIYDHFRESNISSNASQMSSSICQTYQKYQQDVQNGSVSASYGLFDGSVSLSRSQIESIGQMMCKSDYSNQTASSIVNNASDLISVAAVNAWVECQRLSQDGLRASTTFREDDQGEITFNLRYVAPPGTSPQTQIQGVVISPPGAFQCAGSLWDAQGQFMATQSLSMVCERIFYSAPQQVQGRTILAPSATTSVMTAAGSVTRDLTAVIPYPAPPTQTEVLKTALKGLLPDVIPTQTVANANGNGQSGYMQIGDTLFCWGYATFKPTNNPNYPLFDFSFTFPKPFKGIPTVTTGLNGKTSGYAYAVYSHKATETQFGGASLEVLRRASNEPVVMNYFAIGKAQ